MMIPLHTAMLGLLLTVPAQAGPAPASPPAGGAAAAPALVDQAVADLDALSTSLRRMEPGLRHTGQQSSLYVTPRPADEPPTPAGSRLFYRLGQGYVARMDRPDYLVPTGPRSVGRNVAPGRDGRFLELVPANTTFELAPLPADLGRVEASAAPIAPPPSSAADARIDGRVSGRIDGRVDNRLAPAEPHPSQKP